MLLTIVAAVALAQAQPQSLPVITLEESFRLAESQNTDLAAARARLRQADELSRKAWSGYLPQISAQGTYTYNSVEAKLPMPTGYAIRDLGMPTSAPQPPNDPYDPSQPPGEGNLPGAPTTLVQVPTDIEEVVVQRKHSVNGIVQLSQGIIVPQLWPAIRNANLAEKAAGLSVENARREILFATAQLYYGAEGLREAIDVQERLLTVNREREKDAQVRYQVGTVTKVALLRAQIERSRAEQDVQRTRNAYLSMKAALATVIARDDQFEVTRPPVPPAPPGLQQLFEAADSRPDLLAARTNLELAEGQKAAVWYEYAPSIVGFARYQRSNVKGFTNTFDTLMYGAQLSWNLFDGGLRESRLRENAAKVVETRNNLKGLELKVREDVTRALLDLESTRANVTKATEQVKLARESATLVNNAYEAGVATYLELVDANTSLNAAELNAISEELNAQLAVLKVAKAAGLFDPTRSVK